jgi:HEAT repeat protein
MYLLLALLPEDPSTARWAIELVGERAAPVFQVLIADLVDPDLEVQYAAGYQIGRIGRAAAPFLTSALENPAHRKVSAEVLAALGHEQAMSALPALLSHLDSSEFATQFAIIDAVKTIARSDSTSVAKLKEFMATPTFDERLKEHTENALKEMNRWF